MQRERDRGEKEGKNQQGTEMESIQRSDVTGEKEEQFRIMQVYLRCVPRISFYHLLSKWP